MSQTLPTIDHTTEGLRRLIWQYRGRVVLEAWLRAHLTMIQEIDDMFQALLDAFLVDTADLERLKILGRIVGQEPAGASLEAFRLFVKARIAANRSRAKGGDVSTVARILDPAASLTRLYPATLYVEFLSEHFASLEELKAAASLVASAVGAGIGVRVIDAVPDGDDLIFAFGESMYDEVEGGLGSSSDPLVGGVLAGIVTP